MSVRSLVADTDPAVLAIMHRYTEATPWCARLSIGLQHFDIGHVAEGEAPPAEDIEFMRLMLARALVRLIRAERDTVGDTDG